MIGGERQCRNGLEITKITGDDLNKQQETPVTVKATHFSIDVKIWRAPNKRTKQTFVRSNRCYFKLEFESGELRTLNQSLGKGTIKL